MDQKIKFIVIFFSFLIIFNWKNILNHVYVYRCWNILIEDEFFSNFYNGLKSTIFGVLYFKTDVPKDMDLETINQIIKNRLSRLNTYVVTVGLDGVIDFEKRYLYSDENNDIYLIKLIPYYHHKWTYFFYSIISTFFVFLLINNQDQALEYLTEIYKFVIE